MYCEVPPPSHRLRSRQALTFPHRGGRDWALDMAIPACHSEESTDEESGDVGRIGMTVGAAGMKVVAAEMTVAAFTLIERRLISHQSLNVH